MNTTLIRETPWDSVAFGIFTGELAEYSESALTEAITHPGHYTLKVDPLADGRMLRQYGFYYCDTLIEPQCCRTDLRFSVSPLEVAITRDVDLPKILAISQGSFVHGRFHRDLNLRREDADLRYGNWLRQLYERKCVYGLLWGNEVAGFIAYSGSSLVLHAVAESYRGKGLAKYWWSEVCNELFAAGNTKIRSSISAANVAAVNLYASLGFRFRSPVDIYHRLVE